MSLSIHSIRSLEDDQLPAVLDIYQDSFPIREQMRFSWWLQLLGSMAAGQAPDTHLLAVTEEDQTHAFALFETRAGEEPLGYLWYIAAVSESRNRGIGTLLYREIISRAAAAGCRAVVIEVEDPDHPAEAHEAPGFAGRRIAWYRRNGAKLLHGIAYNQDVGWQPPLPMGLMVHPLEPMAPEDALAACRAVLGEVEQVAPLRLE